MGPKSWVRLLASGHREAVAVIWRSIGAVTEVAPDLNPIRFIRRPGDDQNERRLAFEPPGEIPLIAQQFERRGGFISERAQRRLSLHLNRLSGGPQLVVAKLDEPISSSVRSPVSGRPKVSHLPDNAFNDVDPALTDPDALGDSLRPTNSPARGANGVNSRHVIY
jgi:hypothetical protein